VLALLGGFLPRLAFVGSWLRSLASSFLTSDLGTNVTAGNSRSNFSNVEDYAGFGFHMLTFNRFC
jgi:hypothetical protein